MAIQFRCICGKALVARDDQGGHKGRCVTCGATFTIPTFVPAAARFYGDHDEEDDDEEYRRPGVFAMLWRSCWWLGAAVVLAGILLPALQAGAKAAHRDPGEVTAKFLFLTSTLWIPSIASRRGVLTLGRWMIASLLCFVLAAFMLLLMHVDPLQSMDDVLSGGLVMSSLGIFGCMIAAIVPPRSRN